MFQLTKPRAADVEFALGKIAPADAAQSEILGLKSGLRVPAIPPGFVRDRSQSTLGHGRPMFEAAVSALRQWLPFDLGWVKAANPSAQIELGQIVAVQVHSLGLWSLNLSRIVEVINEADSFGFTYRTTCHHVEEGEERFLLTFEPASGNVTYDLEAVSRPRAFLAKVGFPITRAFQRRFARDSHRRMTEFLSRLVNNPE